MMRVRLTVTGRVQGVSYRARAQEKARALGVTGYARNLPDGTVDILAEGETAWLEEFIAWCRKGPAFAKVSHVAVVAEDYLPGEHERFLIRY
jgi:acylphosphatase